MEKDHETELEEEEGGENLTMFFFKKNDGRTITRIVTDRQR